MRAHIRLSAPGTCANSCNNDTHSTTSTASSPGQTFADMAHNKQQLESNPSRHDHLTSTAATIMSATTTLNANTIDDKLTTTSSTTTTCHALNVNKFDLSPATLEALKTLTALSSKGDFDKLTNCGKLTASLEQIRANKNCRLFEKLDKIKQDFSGLNHKLAQMEESILDLKEVTSNLVKSLP